MAQLCFQNVLCGAVHQVRQRGFHTGEGITLTVLQLAVVAAAAAFMPSTHIFSALFIIALLLRDVANSWFLLLLNLYRTAFAVYVVVGVGRVFAGYLGL